MGALVVKYYRIEDSSGYTSYCLGILGEEEGTGGVDYCCDAMQSSYDHNITITLRSDEPALTHIHWTSTRREDLRPVIRFCPFCGERAELREVKVVEARYEKVTIDQYRYYDRATGQLLDMGT